MYVVRNLTAKIRSASAMAVCRKNHFVPVFTSLVCNKKAKQFSTKQFSPEEAKKANWQARVDLAAALRGFEMMNFHEGICNHLSAIVPAANGDGEVMLVNNYGYHWREVSIWPFVVKHVKQGLEKHRDRLINA